jgi:hypothetical protein
MPTVCALDAKEFIRPNAFHVAIHKKHIEPFAMLQRRDFTAHKRGDSIEVFAGRAVQPALYRRISQRVHLRRRSNIRGPERNHARNLAIKPAAQGVRSLEGLDP